LLKGRFGCWDSLAILIATGRRGDPGAWKWRQIALNGLRCLARRGLRAEELLVPKAGSGGELETPTQARTALPASGGDFALIHTVPARRGPWKPSGQLGGLIMLGSPWQLATSVLTAGALWGAIGLQWGLVGGWFRAQMGLDRALCRAPAG